MKHTLASLLAAFALATVAIPAQATTTNGYVRNWWVEENGDINFYLLNSNNSAYVNGVCGSPLFRLKVGQANYDQAYTSLTLAAKNGYMVGMEVTTCDGTNNVIKMVKVCTWTGDC
jgi:hypothetical protein